MKKKHIRSHKKMIEWENAIAELPRPDRGFAVMNYAIFKMNGLMARYLRKRYLRKSVSDERK